MRFRTVEEALELVYRSYNAAQHHMALKATDDVVRAGHPAQTAELLRSLGHPDRTFESIVVVGSKGKGSTAAMLASLLAISGGQPVGLFTSPHLVSPLERVRVDGQAVPEDLFLDAISSLAPTIEGMERSLPAGAYISPICVYLAVACLCFRELGVRYAVLEAGRGGSLDPVNAVPHKWVVITEVFKEHVDRLGPRLVDIGRHKSGAVTSGVHEVVCGASSPVVRELVRQRCEVVGSRLRMWGKDFKIKEVAVEKDAAEGTIWFKRGGRYRVLVRLRGRFQLQNAALALAAAMAIQGGLDESLASRALGRVRLHGRCDLVREAPEVMVDGAVHRRAANYLAELARVRGRAPTVAVMAVPTSKDYRGVFRVLSRVASLCILTRPDNNAGFSFPSFESVRSVTRGREVEATYVEPLGVALDHACRLAGSTGMVLLAGTQVAVGEVMARFRRDCRVLWDD